MFYVRYKATSGGAYTTIALNPAPTNVEYPDHRLYKAQNTQDGAVVIQRPLRDDRIRRWIWKAGRSTVTSYENQWQVLKTLEYRHRLRNNLHPIVEIWEDLTDTGGFGGLTAGSDKVWTKVKFLQVHRRLREGGGRVIYEDSIIEFVIADDTYTAF